MEARDPTLAAVEEFIGAKHKSLNFPPWLEQQFESDTRRRRCQRLRAALLPNVIIYNLFLIADWFLIPDQFRLAVLLHAFVVIDGFASWVACERANPDAGTRGGRGVDASGYRPSNLMHVHVNDFA